VIFEIVDFLMIFSKYFTIYTGYEEHVVVYRLSWFHELVPFPDL